MRLDDLLPILSAGMEANTSIRRSGWDPEEEALNETLFSVANGHQGLRATIGPDVPGTRPGSFVIGLEGPGLAVPRELVKVPSWTHVEVVVGDQECRLDLVEVEEVARTLDVVHGLSHVAATFADGLGRRTRIEWWLAAHRTRGELGFVVGVATPLGHDAPVAVRWGVDGRAANGFMGGEIEQIALRHCDLDRTVEFEAGVVTSWSVDDSGREVVVGAAWVGDGAMVRPARHDRYRVEMTSVGRRGTPTVFGIVGLLAIGPPSAEGWRRRLTAQTEEGAFCALVDEHRRASQRHWDEVAVRVEGDHEVDEGCRLGTFHLLQNLPAEAPLAAQVASRGLTSEYHSGHVFFNSDLYLVPWLIGAWPAMARALLVHRIGCLDAARQHAATEGFRGAMYPEEASFDGQEASAHEVKDIFRGTTVVEWSGREVIHLSADVAWAIDRYLATTHDRSLLDDGGTEALAEIARFCASALVWDPARQAFTTRRVMGPDEFHYHVDDNAYTNAMIAGALHIAATRLAGSTHATPDEQRTWRRIAALVLPPATTDDGLIEQHTGYFDLPDKSIAATAANGLPQLDAEDQVAADGLQPFTTKLIKQADVVMLIALRPDVVDDARARANLDFYEPRTAHGSSLSFGPHGMVAARLGDVVRARDHAARSLRYDLDFQPRAGFANGLHLAGYAAGLRIILEGILRLKDDPEPTLDPLWPPGWTGVSVRILRGGRTYELRAHPDRPSTVTVVEERGVRAHV